MSATDDEGDTLTYELGGTDAGAFDFDTATGQIKTKDELDHEDIDTYYVTVSVYDGKADDGSTEDTPVVDTYIDVTIEVEDVNEKPAFDANSARRIPDHRKHGCRYTHRGRPHRHRRGPADTLTYGLTGTDAVSFDVDDTTGQIKTKADLNHESKETYSVTVTVSDGRDDAGDDEQTPVADATIDVTITVTDVDEPGSITLPVAPPSAGSSVTAVLEDQDGVKTDVDVEWVWSISTDQTTWTPIDGATTDTYIPQEDDIGNYLQVTATYDDEFGTDKTAIGETAAVLREPATNLQPSFADTSATRSIWENTAADTNIGDAVEATHPDNVGTLVYSLDTAGATSFDIDSATGQLKTKAALDHEITSSYTFTVSVTDERDDYRNADTRVDDTIEVTITVTNLDIPAVPDAPTVTVTPGAAAGLTVTWDAIVATDDAPVDGYDVHYRKRTPLHWRLGQKSQSQRTAPP